MLRIWCTKLHGAQFGEILKLWEMLMNLFRVHMFVMDVRLLMKKDYYVEIQAKRCCVFSL